MVLRELLHFCRTGLIVAGQALELRGVLGQELLQHALFHAGGEKVSSGEYEIDITAPGTLHRFELARKFGCRRLRVIDLRDQIWMLDSIRLDGLLRQRKVSSHIHDAERHRT